MIDMVSIANLSIAIIAFAFLGFVLSLNVIGSVSAFGVALASSTISIVCKKGFFIDGVVGAIPGNRMLSILSVPNALGFAFAYFALLAKAIAITSLIASKIFTCCGLCLTTLGAGFCGIMGLHKILRNLVPQTWTFAASQGYIYWFVSPIIPRARGAN